MADWFLADLHMGHQRLIDGWADENGVTVPNSGPRGQFPTVEAMFETIRDNARRVVQPGDKFWLLGDIALKDSALRLVAELPGETRAVLGNHDLARAKLYASVFKKVYGAKVLEGGFLLTHIPIHPNSLDRKSMQINIHGHLHEAVVTRLNDFYSIDKDGSEVWDERIEPDPRYVCVSCEQTNYTPISLDQIKARVTALGVWSPPEPRPLRPGTTYERSDHPQPRDPAGISLTPGATL